MVKEMRRILDETLCEVFEKQAFLFAEETPPKDIPSPSGKVLSARITFTGTFSGSITLYVTEAMCSEIAANFLGVEPDTPGISGKAPDALKEVLNVICGNFLTAAAGDGPVFDLTVPQASSYDEGEWVTILAIPNVMSYLVDDYAVACHLELQH
jgi:CheY-specific phosphatase CheX